MYCHTHFAVQMSCQNEGRLNVYAHIFIKEYEMLKKGGGETLINIFYLPTIKETLKAWEMNFH